MGLKATPVFVTSETDASDLASDEARLICELAGVPRLDAEALRRLAGIVDWSVVLGAARPGLWPLLAHRVRERGLSVPALVLMQLDAARRDNLIAWMQRRAALRAVLGALGSAGFDVTVLKGMALAPTVYPSPELRTMSDMDLWVHAPTLDGVAEVLAPLGWHLPGRRDSGATDRRRSVGLALGDPPLMMELHAPPASLEETVPGLSSVLVARRVEGEGWTILAPADQLLHLAVHAASHHRFTGVVVGLLDMALLIDRVGAVIDWRAFGVECRAQGAERCVAVALGAAEQLFGGHVPAEAWDSLSAPDAPALGRTAAEIAWWSHVSGQNPAAVLATPGMAGLAGAVSDRIGHLMRDRSALDVGAPIRLARRVWQFIRYVAPRHVAALRRGAHAGAEGASRRERYRRHAALMHALAPDRS